MLVGCPKEIKNHEYRVGLVPETVRELKEAGADVLIESGAAAGIGISDADYRQAGAEIAPDAAAVFERADMIVKVKEPLPEEYGRFRKGQILFAYLHLAAEPELTRGLMDAGVTAIAYETVTDERGGLPLLAPMSQVAGRMSVQVGAHFLEREQGGAGILLGGVPGVERGRVVVIGGGMAGTNATFIAHNMGANVTVIERSMRRIQELDTQFAGHLRITHSTRQAIEHHVPQADLLIGSVLAGPGADAPKLVSRDLVAQMRPGSVIVDIAIDQGGCLETSRPTSHADPVYVEEGVTHYCVTNMPGAVARSSTLALNNATRPYILALAELGADKAMARDPHLAAGLNVAGGEIVHGAVADALAD